MMNRVKWEDPIKQWRAIRAAVPVAPTRSNGGKVKARADERAANNVAEWRKFLTNECVEAMVKDGWHRRV